MEPLTLIDIETVIRKKNPGMARVMPRFVVRIIEKIVRQDSVNKLLIQHAGGPALDLVRGTLEEIKITYSAHHFDRVPNGKRYVFVSNHPLGGLDGLILMDQIASRFPDFRFVVNDVLMNLATLKEVFLPVNKFGRQKQEYVALFDDVFASDAQIIFFPAGLCSRRINGRITDLPWSKTFLNKALQYHRDIVPVHFSGRNSGFFYWLSNFRKKIGIEANIEMFFLPNEMFRQKGKRLSLVFGEPISWEHFDSSRTQAQWVDFVREKVYELA